MTETAKERIENEIKSVEKRLHRGRNDGKTYNTGVKEGLMIARAHVIDSVTTDKLSVEKLQEQLNTAKKNIEHAIGTIKHDGHLGTIQTDWILAYLEKVLEAIGNEGSGDESC